MLIRSTGEKISLGKPEKLTTEHDMSDFSCGEKSLDDYLIDQALKNQGVNAVIYVVCIEGTKKVVGYYTLSNGSVARIVAPNKMSRYAPKDIPVTVLGRLAVDQQYSGYGIGSCLLKEAVMKSFEASNLVGSRAMLVHALNDDIVSFYTKYGFSKFPSQPLTLFISLKISSNK